MSHAEEAGVCASIDHPAAIVATRGLGGARVSGASPQIVVEVIGYTPASDDPVEAVVTARSGGTDREIGRISIFPRTAFDASEPDKIQRFAFPLPEGVAADAALPLTITVKASDGTGRGANFVFGGATIE